MRLKWFRNLNAPLQILVLSSLILLILIVYIPVSKYIKPAIASLILSPLKLADDLSSSARQFLKFQDLMQQNKMLKDKLDKLTAQLVSLEDLRLENQRLRSLLSLSERKLFQTQAALIISKDSSNWTKTVVVNKGTKSAVKVGMPVVLGENLVGKVVEAYPFASKVALIIDFNSKIPAQILRTREEGVVFGTFAAGENLCKIKYLHQVQIGDKVVSSGLGNICPKGLLIGEVMKVEAGENNLYKVAQIKPAVDFATLEEVMIITDQ